MWTVIQQDNFCDILKLPSLASELGFEKLTLSLNLTDWGQKRWKEINEQATISKSFEVTLAERLVDLGNEHDVEVTFWFIDEKYSCNSYSQICPCPFETVFVSSDMRIVPCCLISNPEVYDLGDAGRLNEEWNSEKMRLFRRTHLEGKILNICQSCYRLD